MDKARETAVKVLSEVHADGAYANVALAKALREQKLSEQDRRFVTELVYGTVKAGGTLDWILSRYAKNPIQKMHPAVREILRLGLYQLFYLDKVPASAACNTSVELAKKLAPRRLSGFVNAVLRTAVREPERAAFPKEKPDVYLALASQHPLWFVRRWIKELGAEETEKLTAFDNTQAPLCLRANTLRVTREELLQQLEAGGAVCEPSAWAPEGIVVRKHGALDAMKPLQDGLAQVQDESSMLVAQVLDPRPGEFIIDCCAAPGGKSTHIAQKMRDEGRILAGDIYDHKIARIEENAKRLGITILEAEKIDAREIGGEYEEMADRVLVDAPCSGLGVLRRKPDARWRKSAKEIRKLPELQMAILESAARAVKPDGILVYSTCTIEQAENADVVRAFLAKHPEFYIERAGAFLPAPHGHGNEDMVQLYPQRDGTDGFFIARMHKVCRLG